MCLPNFQVGGGARVPPVPLFLRPWSPKSEAKASGYLQSAITTTLVLSMQTAPMRGELYFSSSVVLHAFSVQACYAHIRRSGITLPPGYPCVKFCFCLAPTAELAHEEKSDTQSLTHSPSLFDVPGTEASTSELAHYIHSTNTNLQNVKQAALILVFFVFLLLI